MKVKFLQDREAKDGNQNTPLAEAYHEGQVVDLPQSSAEHWISRGVAVKVDERVERVAAPRQATPTVSGARTPLSPLDKEDEDEKKPDERKPDALTTAAVSMPTMTGAVGAAVPSAPAPKR